MKLAKTILVSLFYLLLKLLVMLWASLAYAGAFEVKDISADSTWVAHVNVDAARSSKVIQKFHEECFKGDCHVCEHVKKMLDKIGVENPADLHDLTAYGKSIKPHKGVLIVRAKFDKEAAIKHVEKAHDHEMQKYRDYEIHSWEMRDGRRHHHEMAGAFYKPEVLVLASSVDLTKSALDVLDGKAPTLQDKNNSLGEKPPEGTIFLARAMNINQAEAVKDHCPILQQVERIDYAEGEQGDKWAGHVSVFTVSKPAAENLQKVIEGFGAFLSLRYHDDPKITEMISSVKVATDGNTIKMVFEEPVDKVVEQTPAICKAIREHLMKKKEWHRERHG